MIELHLIGSVALSRTDGGICRPLSLAPKPLALLSYLTLGSRRGLHRRDFLLALFWPDMAAHPARNALSQTISRIRAVLGSSAIESRGTEEICVDPNVVWCDAQAFDAFCRRGAWKDALDLYTGDLLSGFHLAGAPGFEIWRDMESARFRRLGFEAAWKLAEQEAGNTVAAALWLRRALAIVPTDERALRQLLQLLEEAGEPASALAAYEEQRQRLLREFEFEPDLETQAFANRIRRRVSHRALGPGTTGAMAQPSRGQGGITSLAVLPFHNLSGNTAEDYFANGMTDALINALGQLRSVRVISRQSSIAYRGTAHTLSRIAAELQVDGVVEGSVLRAGNRVRITAQLIRARPEEHVWADSYDRTMEDILGIHREVARHIAAHVLGGVAGEAPQSAREQIVDPLAFEAFLKGRHYSTMWPQISKGVEYFEQSIALDPAFAPAHAALALCYFQMATFALISPAKSLPSLESATRRALALDESLSDAHVALAMNLGISRSDWPGGTERELLRAVELDPSNAYAHAYLGGHRVALGQVDGIDSCERALRLDPLNPWMLQTVGWAHYRMRNLEQAERTYRSMLEMHPHLGLPHPFLAQIYLQQGRYAEAVKASRHSRALQHDDSLVLGYGAAILAIAGKHAEARDWLHALMQLADRQYVDPYYLAAASAGMGETDRALRWLEQMCRESSTSFWLVRTDPLFDNLQSNPRFKLVLASLGFPDIAEGG